MKRRVFDQPVKKMAVDVSDAKGSIREAGQELEIVSGSYQELVQPVTD